MPKVANKVIYGGQVLINLENDTVTAADVLAGVTFHLPDGTIATGSCNYDAYTGDADAAVAEVLAGKTFYKNGQKLTGTMPNRGAQNAVISTKNGSVTIQNGYHDGSGSVSIDPTEVAKIIAENIKEGVEILGVTGTCSPASGVTSTSVSVTPYTTQQTILPPSGYDYISQVNVAAIAYTETENAAGGLTVTIGTVAPT